MSEAKFYKLLDKYTRETGFAFDKVQKKWAFIGAKYYHKKQLKKKIEMLDANKIDKGGFPLNGYENAENDGIEKAINLLNN